MAMALCLALCLSLLPISATAAFTIERNDGTWLFPLSEDHYHKRFSDWAGCPGDEHVCPICGEDHQPQNWGDGLHTKANGNVHGHNGIDLVAFDAPVFPAADGKVVRIIRENEGEGYGRGNTVVIEHKIKGTDYSYYSYYQHLSAIHVSVGDTVEAGYDRTKNQIAITGQTGFGTGPHLHFGIVRGVSNNGGDILSLENKGWLLSANQQEGSIVVNPSKNSPIPNSGSGISYPEVTAPLKYHAGSVTYTFNKEDVSIPGVQAPPTAQAAMMPLKYVYVTQDMGGSYSHSGTKSMDFGGKVQDLEAPFDCVVKYCNTDYVYGNEVVIQSVDKVRFADGSYDYMTVSVIHDNHIEDMVSAKASNRVIKQGEIFYSMGDYGNVTGVHVHLCVAKGQLDFSSFSASHRQSAEGNWELKNSINPSDAFFIDDSITIANGAGHKWTKLEQSYDPDYPFSIYAYENADYTVIKEFDIRTAPSSKAPYIDSNSKVNVGERITVKKLVINESNAYNNIWFEMEHNGSKGFLFSGYLLKNGQIERSKVSGTNEYSNIYIDRNSRVDNANARIEGTIAPKGDIQKNTYFQNYGFEIGGTVKCSNSLVMVEACITGNNTDLRSSQTFSDLNTTSYNIGGNSPVNRTLVFNNLAPGTYTYTVYATYHANLMSSCVRKEVYSSTFNVVMPDHTTHNYDYSTQVVAPTCTKGGYTRHICSCTAYRDDTVTQPLGHDYRLTNTVAPSCESDGSAVHICARCNDYQIDSIEKTGHTWAEEAFAADCTHRSGVNRECTVCGKVETEYTAAQWSDWSPDYPEGVDAAKIETGTQTRFHQRKTVTIPEGATPPAGSTFLRDASGWSDYGSWSAWQNTAVSASDSTEVQTRTTYAYGYFLCPKCGAHMHGYGSCYTWAGGCGAATNADCWRELWSTTSFSKAGFSDWYGTGHETAIVDGQRVFRWNANKTQTEYRYRTRVMQELDEYVLAPEWSAWSFDAPPTGGDYISEDRSVYRYDASAVGEHSWDEGTVTLESTCERTGVRTFTCTECSQTRTEEIERLPHAFTDEVIAPGCTETGHTIHSCSVCGYCVIDHMLEPVGHQWNAGKVLSSDCEESGVVKYTCERCGDTRLEEIAPVGHEYVEYLTEPTCTEPGLRKTVCVYCGDCIAEDELPAAGHMAETVPASAPTCLKPGTTAGTRCSVCDLVLTGITTIPVTDHSFAEPVMDPENAGYMLSTCETCGEQRREPVDDNAPRITAASVKAGPGAEAAVTISIANNPGFINLGIEIAYDSAALELIAVDGNTSVGATLTKAQSNSAMPYSLDWSVVSNNDFNGTLATLTFRVREAAQDGVYPIAVDYYKGPTGNYTDGEDLNYREDYTPLGLRYSSGAITVASYTPGDINDDGTINSKDGICLLRHLANWTQDHVVMEALDVDGNGTVNSKDGISLLRYLAGWDITLH